jgi:hypothetical protein
MPSTILLVPGTGGTRLQTGAGADLGYPERLQIGALTGGLIGTNPDELEELLSMEHAPGQLEPVRTSLKANTTISSGDVLDLAYNLVPTSATRFVYDWRADLRFNAQRLKDFLETTTPNGTRWDIISHSQGGLIVLLASMLMDAEDAFARYVRTVFLVGVPIAGTVNAARALITGSNLGETAAPIMKKVMRTWPSIYQMMPAWPMVRLPSGNVAPDDQQHFELPGWDGHEGISEDFLLRMQQTQKKLRDPFSHLDDVKVFWMLASNRNTTVMLRRKQGKITADGALDNKGDTLVPLVQSLRWIGEQHRNYVVNYERGVNPHAWLLDDPIVMANITDLRK